MVQRKVLPNRLGIKAEHVKSENKHLANLKLSSSQNQDGKSRGAEMKKKMKKSKSIKLSHLESLQSSPSRKSMSQPGKPPPLQAPKSSESPQKQNLDGSPNYMKPTSSSHAKKELFPIIHRKTQLGCSDFKNLPRRFSNDVSKGTSSASSKNKATKALTRTSSLSLVRTLTKTTSFKSSRVFGPRKFTRTTCSSTLKDSKFPSYLMLHPGGTQSEGTSVMKVCPYNYCSLNDHRHSDLPPLKTFMSSRRRLLKTQKRAKMEALSPRRLKVLNETEKEDSVLEQSSPVFELSSPVFDEIGIDFFIEIYANEKDVKPRGEEEMGKTDFVNEIEEKEDIKSTIEDHGIIVDTHSAPKSVIDVEEALENDVGVEVDTKTKGFFYQEEQNEQDADQEKQASWTHEEMSMGSYLSDDSDSKANDMEWEEDQFFGFNHEEEENDSKVESSSESSHDASVSWLDDILSSYYEEFLVDETLKEVEANSEESNIFEEQTHGISSVLEGTSGSTEAQETEYSTSELMFHSDEYLENAEDDGGESRKQVDDEDCSMKILDEDKIDQNSQSEEMSESYKIDVNDERNSEENQIHMFNEPEESNKTIQDHDLLGEDQTKAKKFQNKRYIDDEEENTSKNWKIEISRKRRVDEDDEEMRKFNPREPNFLPLVPEPEPEKVDLKHQMMDERKNAEEWMIDSALRQAVTKLAPARKKKVALLVEAFETVMPIPKFETHMRNNSSFSHARRIQACS